jgi:hypothetical protein
MKKFIMAGIILTSYTAYSQDNSELKATAIQTTQSTETSYGKTFDAKGAISVAELTKKAADKEINDVVVYGKIDEVCQAEGCWMRVFKGSDKSSGSMMVRFKDHSFFIPKDLAGKDVVFMGRAYPTKISVQMQKHYAEDAGKSKEEIEKITEPSEELAFEATGLIIK